MQLYELVGYVANNAWARFFLTQRTYTNNDDVVHILCVTVSWARRTVAAAGRPEQAWAWAVQEAGRCVSARNWTAATTAAMKSLRSHLLHLIVRVRVCVRVVCVCEREKERAQRRGTEKGEGCGDSLVAVRDSDYVLLVGVPLIGAVLNREPVAPAVNALSMQQRPIARFEL